MERRVSQNCFSVHSIAEHFEKYFSLSYLNEVENPHSGHQLRHHVYCEELAWEPCSPNGYEMDEFDSWSPHCLITHKSTGHLAGGVRMVSPSDETELLPIEAALQIETTRLSPSVFPRDTLLEISRLAIHKRFRKRKDDYATSSILTGDEVKCFSYISLGLYMAALAYALKSGRVNCFVVMETRLHRHMQYFGIHAEQVGPVVNYHGRRAPFYINGVVLQETIKPNARTMLESMATELSGAMDYHSLAV